MLKKYNVVENYNFVGVRKIPFNKMDEKELIEALTPENQDSLERITWWELDLLRDHPSVDNVICIKENHTYDIIFKIGKVVRIRTCSPDDIVLPPMTADEIMKRDGSGMS